MSTDWKKAGAFIVIDGTARSLSLRDRAAQEWDCEREEIAVCLRCLTLQPVYVMKRYGDNLVCELCFDELT